jgi:hypothetical protein
MTRRKQKNSKAVVLYKQPQAQKPKAKDSEQRTPKAVATVTSSQGVTRSTGRKLGYGLPYFAAAQYNPFSSEVLGVKVPDESTAPSCTAFGRGRFNYSTGVLGGCGTVFRYHAQSTAVNVTPATSTSWVMPAGFAGIASITNVSAVQANFSILRTVAWGIKIDCRQSYTNASGFVHVAQIGDPTDGSTWNWPTSVAQMEFAPAYRRIPIADLIDSNVLVCGRYTDNSAFSYYNPGNPDVPGGREKSTPGWMGIMVWVEAPASTANVLDIEYMAHYEAISASTNATSGVVLETKAAPYSPTVMAATNYAVDTVEPIRVVENGKENTRDYWRDLEGAYNIGCDIANGVATALKWVGLTMLL